MADADTFTFHIAVCVVKHYSELRNELEAFSTRHHDVK